MAPFALDDTRGDQAMRCVLSLLGRNASLSRVAGFLFETAAKQAKSLPQKDKSPQFRRRQTKIPCRQGIFPRSGARRRKARDRWERTRVYDTPSCPFGTISSSA